MTFIQEQGFTDSFNKKIVDSTRNLLDIASHYPYNSERWNLHVDGSRVFPEYGSVSQYNHADDVHELIPASGETVTLSTKERVKYTVQYELHATWAVQLNQALADGDTLRVGFWDGDDGYYLEQNGSEHTSSQATLVVLRNGTEIQTEEVTLPKSTEEFTRISLSTNWYRVGRQFWEQSYTDNGYQKNEEIGRTSIDTGTDTGPRTGNLPLRFEIVASGSTTGLKLLAGSVGASVLGDVSPIYRIKTGIQTGVSVSSANTWVPVAAYRVDPTRSIVKTELANLEILDYSETATNDIRLKAIIADTSRTDASTWTPPDAQTDNNSVIEMAGSVSTFPNESGTEVSSSTDPGGFQIGYSWLFSSGSGSRVTTTTGGTLNSVSPVSEGEIMILLANAEATGTVSFAVTTKQQW